MERSSVGEFICNGAARIARRAERPPVAGLYRLKKDSSMKCSEGTGGAVKNRADSEAWEHWNETALKHRNEIVRVSTCGFGPCKD